MSTSTYPVSVDSTPDSQLSRGLSMSPREQLETSTHAITSVNLETRIGDGAALVPDWLLGDTKLTVTPRGGEAVFAAVATTDRADAYLAGVDHTVVVDFDTAGFGRSPVYADTPGQAPATAPAAAIGWSALGAGLLPLSVVLIRSALRLRVRSRA